MDLASGTCAPMKVYILFMIALVFFDLYEGHSQRFMRSIFYLVTGATFLYVLCAAGMEYVGWVLLMIPVLFVIFILVILIFDQGFLFEREYKNRLRCGTPASPPATCPSPAPVPSPEQCEPEPEPEC